MTSPSVSDIRDQVRQDFGPNFVSARVAAENDARELLNKHAGRMSREDFSALGSAFNRHEVLGVLKRNRFAPAFQGNALVQMTLDLDGLNSAVQTLWTAPMEDALALTGQIMQTRVPFGAGSSLPTMIMYLREPDEFGMMINATMRGLQVATNSKPYTAKSGAGYLRFNEELFAWRNEWEVEPQEHDAVLTALFRAAAKKSAQEPVESDGVAEIEQKAERRERRRSTAVVAEACHLPVEDVDEWVAALEDGPRQALFQGPPGTGKTWVARHLALHLATSPHHVRQVQFHPAFSYEDFVEGLRPEVDAGSGGLTYAVRPGLFRRLCSEAAAAPDEQFVLLVDEMNRADLAAVFGELLMLLEYRGRSAQLPYSHENFSVPENVILLGTMNTADRSLALVDFALRRRFHAFWLRPSRRVLSRWIEREGSSDLPARVFDLVAERVGDDAAAPGHSYWMGSDDAASLLRAWSFQVHPYLAELWFDRPERLEELDKEVRLLLGEGS